MWEKRYPDEGNAYGGFTGRQEREARDTEWDACPFVGKGFFYFLVKVFILETRFREVERMNEGVRDKQVDMPTAYQPREVEAKWSRFWKEEGCFTPKGEGERRFSIVIPPPNVTGKLHIGHALDFTLQDILIRMKRMQGYDTLWLPGTDHAGIATQARVEAQLRTEGLTRQQLGREKFLERVWQWKEEYATAIRQQWEKLGLSLDYTRERFTMDEGLSRAVRKVFVDLYNKGLIYRGEYIINWDPETRTALSDIEVEYKEVQGKLYHIRYPLVDGSGGIIVATTRPETMLGDTAVAVHPEDERYKHLIGKRLRLPIVGREIPIIADEYVDPEFGSGAVKITPAHDPNDFEVGRRHQLEAILVMDEGGRMNENAGKYQGLDRFECRKQLVRDLEEQGYLVKVEDHLHAVGHSQRSGAVVEPYLSTQWFVKMKPLAEQAIACQKSGRGVKFVPERFEKIYLNWIENVRDWCISRQLWWGHRIPAWYCQRCGETIVSMEDVDTCPHCSSQDLKQDEDVLDTWFSSALWPFSTMGWPEETADMKRYYPTDVLVTGYDIIYFWVARMIFTALEFTGQIPFEYVYIHGLVRDAEGRKMSKSLGNGVDPLDVIERYGADALRFMISTGATPGQDVRFHWERVEMARNFANKVWNASRFVLMNLEPDQDQRFALERLSPIDRWILHRLNETVADVTEMMERFEFAEVGRHLYQFIWDEFCDWYIEFSKVPLYGNDLEARKTTQQVLCFVLDQLLRLLHPMMPFITEEIWQHLPVRGKSLALADWPKTNPDFQFPDAVAEVTLLMEVVRAVRNVRAEMNVPPGRKVTVYVQTDEAKIREQLLKHEATLLRFLNAEELHLEARGPIPEEAVTAVVDGAVIYLPLAGLIDVQQELARLRKELQKLDQEVERVQKKLANPQFVERAPEEVVNEERAKEKAYLSKRAQVKERLATLERLAGRS
jgi:valyl-tRNA synthetase